MNIFLSILRVLASAIGLPLMRELCKFVWGLISKWLEKRKDKKDVDESIKEGEEKLDKIKKAKDNNSESDYNNAIDDI